MHTPEIPSNYEPVSPVDREQLLESFASDPTNPEAWQTAYAWVRHEGDLSDDTVTSNELIGFAELIHGTSPTDRYALTTNFTIVGERWFDVLSTFSSNQVERAKQSVLESFVAQAGDRFTAALDIATGTGKSLCSLESVSKTVVGLDHNPALLAVANERKAAHTSLVEASVTALPFDDESFDVISSSGVIGALDERSGRSFYQEVARVLIPSGLYIDATYYPTETGNLGAEMNAITTSSKAMLADMIVDTISGKLTVQDHLMPEAQTELLDQLGLASEYFLVEDTEAKDGTVSLIHLLQKQ